MAEGAKIVHIEIAITLPAANCTILLKFGTQFDHVTAATLQTVKVK